MKTQSSIELFQANEKQLNRLLSWFEVATRYVLLCMKDNRNQVIIDQINHCGQFVKRRFILGILSADGFIHYNRISEILSNELVEFYYRALAVANESERENIKTGMFIFPAGSRVDWESFLFYFNLIEESLKQDSFFLTKQVVKNALALAFINTAFKIHESGKPFDEQFMDDCIKQINNHITYGFKVFRKHYWQWFDKPPRQEKILRLKEIAANSLFYANEIQWEGLPDSLEPYNQFATPDEIGKAISDWADRHSLKAEALDSTLARESYQELFKLPKIPLPQSQSQQVQAIAVIENTEVEVVKECVSQKNSFNGMPLETIRKYFMQLTVPPKKKAEPFLTPGQVDLFVRRAFVKEKGIEKMTLVVGPRDQSYVWKIFYQLYDYCVRNGIEATTQCQGRYIHLLTDNFTNYTFKQVKANFNGKCKRWWKTPAELG